MTRRRKPGKATAPAAEPMFIEPDADIPAMPTPEEAAARPLQAALQHAAALRTTRPAETNTDDIPAFLKKGGTVEAIGAVIATPTPVDPEPATVEPPAKRQRSPGAKFEALFALAEQGQLPPAPDLTAPTHSAFRKRGAKIVEMAEAGDIEGLKADTTEPKSSSRAIICRFRDLAIVALVARARQST